MKQTKRRAEEDVKLIDSILRLADYGIINKEEAFDLIQRSIWSMESSILGVKP